MTIIGDEINKMDLPKDLKQGLAQIAATALGAAIGGAAGAASGLNVEANNRQLHQTEYDQAKKLSKQAAKWLSALEGVTVTPEQAEARLVRQMERTVDYQTAKDDGFRKDEHIVSFMGDKMPIQDSYYYDTNYNSQYIKPNQAAYNAALAQGHSGLTPQQTVDRNNAAGAPLAKLGAVILGGYMLAPTAAAAVGEVIAFVRNPIAYCSMNPGACLIAVDTAAATAAGVPATGTPIPHTAPTGSRTVANIEGAGANGANNLAEVWNLSPTARGTAIESHLAQTEYKDWFNVGQLNNGKFPLVDFQNGNTLVSVKSVDTAGSTWLGRMQDHIYDLGSNGATVSGKPANMILDLRVQPGGAAAAQPLVQYGRDHGVTVIVKEFK
jgi:hypothetical protein